MRNAGIAGSVCFSATKQLYRPGKLCFMMAEVKRENGFHICDKIYFFLREMFKFNMF